MPPAPVTGHQQAQPLACSSPEDPSLALRRGTFFVQYEVREELGEGAFGKAVRVRRRRDGRMFVAKVMHEQGLSDKAREEVPPSSHP